MKGRTIITNVVTRTNWITIKLLLLKRVEYLMTICYTAQKSDPVERGHWRPSTEPSVFHKKFKSKPYC